jgi:hypothetical protein
MSQEGYQTRRALGCGSGREWLVLREQLSKGGAYMTDIQNLVGASSVADTCSPSYLGG